MRPQDIVIALSTLVAMPKSYAERGQVLGMSPSEVHAGEKRLLFAGLLEPDSNRVKREPFRQFLIHGVPYAFAVTPAELTRGVPTAWAAPVLRDRFVHGSQVVPVWPDPEGDTQGAAVKPLYRSVPQISRKNRELYALFALVDALRIGRARERKMAENELNQWLKDHVAA